MDDSAYHRLLAVAKRGTGQSEDVAAFLLAWYNVKAWGGWGPHTIRGLDGTIQADILSLLAELSRKLWYPPSEDMEQLIRMYRS